MKKILVTGGAGFIGSHTVVELVQQNYEPVILDNLCNSSDEVISRIEKICNKKIDFFSFDVRETEKIVEVMTSHNIKKVIHFAALKSVGESVENPLNYYDNNILGLISLLKAMEVSNANELIFSSSATVYGNPDELPLTEDSPLKPATNPYGSTKQMAERILEDISKTGKIKTVLLRYFNPIGAHSSGLIGELPLGIPSNLVPFVTQTAAGLRAELTVFGDDYDTPDGSCIRDYIHVVDLAKAHVKALTFLENAPSSVCEVFNLGTGKGTSVLEILQTFKQTTGVTVPYHIGERRSGDVASCYSSPKKAEEILHWKAELDVAQGLKDAWKWQQKIVEAK